jgi:Protein of unknown function (DUF1524)
VHKRSITLAAAFVLALAAGTLGPLSAPPAEAVTSISTLKLLAALPVKAEYTGTYDRAKFTHWIDADGDGCDTRREVLILESTVKPTVSSSCSVKGKWTSVFDKKTWTDPLDVDIDHLVALSEAWDSGAASWSAAKRRAFANDLGYSWSLVVMTDNMNSSKSDRDPAQWMPPALKCTYAKGWIGVKYRWGLAIDATEKAALTKHVKAYCSSSPNMNKPTKWTS